MNFWVQEALELVSYLAGYLEISGKYFIVILKSDAKLFIDTVSGKITIFMIKYVTFYRR